MLLSIDPGVNCIGWAKWDWSMDKYLLECGIVKPYKKRQDLGKNILDMTHQLPPCSTVVIELPKMYPRERKVDPNDLIRLAAVAGACSKLGRTSEVYFVLPQEWKGQVPKEIQHKRMLGSLPASELTTIERALKNTPKGLQHNMLDAIGIGVYWRKKHVR